jgi:hypothetical protein
MASPNDPDLRPMPEQITYANLLFYGAWLGIFLLMVTYFLYVSGLLSPHVKIPMVPQYWGKSVHDYMAATGSPQGWDWTALLHKGDFLNFIGMALLAVMTIFCYIVLIPGYIRRKDWSYTVICVLEVLVLSLAASGILGGGGH